jgi:hypothetical protein
MAEPPLSGPAGQIPYPTSAFDSSASANQHHQMRHPQGPARVAMAWTPTAQSNPQTHHAWLAASAHLSGYPNASMLAQHSYLSNPVNSGYDAHQSLSAGTGAGSQTLATTSQGTHQPSSSSRGASAFRSQAGQFDGTNLDGVCVCVCACVLAWGIICFPFET